MYSPKGRVQVGWDNKDLMLMWWKYLANIDYEGVGDAGWLTYGVDLHLSITYSRGEETTIAGVEGLKQDITYCLLLDILTLCLSMIK